MIEFICKNCTTEISLCCDPTQVVSTVFDGLMVKEDNMETLLHRPFEVTFQGQTAVLSDYKGTIKSVDLSETIYPDVASFQQAILDCKCPASSGTADVDIIEITDANLAVAGSPTPADVQVFAAANGYDSGDVIVYPGNGTIDTPDYAFYVDTDGDAVMMEKPSAGGGIFTYTVGDAVITATGPGVGFTKAGGTGTFSVPAGVKLLSAKIQGTSADLDGSNAFTVCHDHPSDLSSDTTETDYNPPIIQKVNEAAKAASGLATAPFPYDIDSDPQMQILSVGGGQLCTRIINLNGLPFWALKLHY